MKTEKNCARLCCCFSAVGTVFFSGVEVSHIFKPIVACRWETGSNNNNNMKKK